jgi:hypothetical protein
MAKLHRLLVIALYYLTNLTAAGTEDSHRTWKWNIDPDLSNPECDKINTVNINPKDRLESASANPNAEKCTTLHNYFDSQVKKSNIDLFLRCDANVSPTRFEGVKNGNLVFTYKVGKSDDAVDWNKHGSYQRFNGTLKVSDRVLGDVVEVDVKLGVKVDEKKRIVKYQYLYC